MPGDADWSLGGGPSGVLGGPLPDGGGVLGYPTKLALPCISSGDIGVLGLLWCL